MSILLELGLLLVLAGLVTSFFMRGRRVSERQAVTTRRVEAYIETIRRRHENAELAAMSDTELRDLLLSAARNLKVQRERRTYLLVGGGLVAVLAAVLVGRQDGAQGFGIALVVGAVVLYGVNEFLGRRMMAPLLERGIDVERLRVE